PLTVDPELMRDGRAAYDEICATCHGVLGNGASVVADKMELRRPPSFLEARLEALPAGEIFAVASRGYGLMPGFASVLDVEQRWAVVAYIRALRLSQSSAVAELPADVLRELTRVAP
ncbi:MAG TPA: cytochrome c, partial [Polyangiaceae bacterium]